MTDQPDRIKRVRQKVSRYCATAERSPRQLKDRLVKEGLSTSQIEQVLQQLRKDNFLNETRFALAYCHDKIKFNAWGKLRVKQELKFHQIPTPEIEHALEAFSEIEYQEILLHVLERKLRQLSTEENLLLKKKKMIDYALRKGFESDLVFKKVQQLLSA